MLKGILKKKLNNDKGFTLAELLIVVAIIAILVAVSIPVFTSQLGKAKVSTDKANIRAAKAAAVNESLKEDGNLANPYYYDAENGVLKAANSGITAYGKSKSTEVKGSDDSLPEGKILELTIGQDGVVTFKWVAPGK